MTTRFAPILLWTVGLLAFAGSSFVLYNFVVNDWRLEGDLLSPESLRSVLGGKERDDDSTRLATWEFPLIDSAEVTIDASLCTISIVPAEASLAEVRIALSGDAVDTALYHTSALSPSPAAMTLHVRPTNRWSGSSRGFVEVEIALPAHTRLILRLRTGDLRIDRISGRLGIEMSDGMFEGTGLQGEIALRNGSGSVRLERCETTGSVELGSGNVAMLFNGGDLRVVAPDGIEARSHFGALEATTREGGIVAEILSARPHCRLASESGSIFLKILPGARTSIAARTQIGMLTHSLRLDLPDSVAFKTPSFLLSTLNGGGDSVVIETRSGLIVLDEYGDRVIAPPRVRIDTARLDTAGVIDSMKHGGKSTGRREDTLKGIE